LAVGAAFELARNESVFRFAGWFSRQTANASRWAANKRSNASHMPAPYWEITSVCWMVFWIYWSFGAPRKGPSKRKVARTFTVLNTGLLYLGFLLVLSGRSVPGSLGLLFVPQAISIYVTGTVFAIIGVAFAIWSRQSLRHNWSGEVAIMEGQQFMRNGPYAIVRHPIYAGMLLALLGTALVSSTVGSLLGFVLAILSLWQKASIEEQFLIVEFGEQYANYQRDVKFLIPFIY
jgi:protein-S-isoprenylcysteine O-methyltransferase Ste14